MYVCMCVYVCVFIYIHTYTQGAQHLPGDAGGAPLMIGIISSSISILTIYINTC